MMSPIRIVILAILFYIAYLLITSGRRKKKKVTKRQPETKQSGPVSDVLVEDPVCHSLVPKQQAVHLQHNDEMIYFCSEECCRKFVEEHNKK